MSPRPPPPPQPGGEGVYVHLPWCRVRCPYCAFVVSGARQPPHATTLTRLLEEWAAGREHLAGTPTTLFFGGGTPSRTPPADVATLVRAIGPSGEVSLEANADDVDADRVSAWADAGVTRLSLGVQSFQPEVARRLGRTTSARAGRSAVLAATRRFRNVSVDLIFGVPGQTTGQLAQDLAELDELGVPHVSAYGLTIEPGTPFHRAGFQAEDDDRWADQYAQVVDTLEAAGLERYEVSNFARPGHRCVHNEHYWRARPWLGLGPGAHGWLSDGRRTRRTADVEAWLRGDPSPEPELPTDRELAAELVGSTLRHVDGLDRTRLRAWTGLDVAPPPALATAAPWSITRDRIVLEKPGFALVDGLAARLCAHLVAAGSTP